MNITNPDSPFVKGLSQVGNLILLNWIFLLCSIPIVTIGASVTAMHDVGLRLVRKEEPAIIKSFFAAFKRNFKQATIIWLILLLLGVILIVDLFIGPDIISGAWGVMLIAAVVIGVLWLIEWVYTFPLQARYENTVRQTLKSAFILGVAYIPWTLVLIAITVAVPLLIIFCEESWAMLLMLATFILFSGLTYISDTIINHIFLKSFPGEKQAQDEKNTLLPD